MTAYVLIEVELIDLEAMGEYRELARKAVAEFDGQFLAVNAAPEPVEGDWDPKKNFTLLSFPSMERARAWYDSDTYAPGKEIAKRATLRRISYLTGLDEAR
ncbi:DUF1330 domain-containing protein [Streptomyces sp. NPDC051976]|uniref:DUF1330 domain-containing protein n=1 Tax=Streptomyces sp. NPDC051976 TaxID=3154947 RepID=UPI0034362340